MTWSAVGSWLSGTSTVALNNQAVGNLILLEVENKDTTVWATSVSGGGVTWAQLGTRFTGTVNARSAVVFAGTVTATGVGNATVTFNGSPTSNHAVAHEFHSTAGSWSLDVQGDIDSSGTNTWASLTPAGAGELYFGFAVNAGSASAGSTSGYVYSANADGSGNGALYNTACTSSAQAPVWGDSTEIFGVMVLVKETGSGGGTESGSFAIALPAPAASLAGTAQHTESGGLAVVSPTPVTSLTGKVAHAGAFSLTLPALLTPLTGTAQHTESGTFHIVLPASRTTLSGTDGTAGTVSGAFLIVLPPGWRNASEGGLLSPVLHAPAVFLAGARGHVGTFNVTLPVPASALSARVGHVNGSLAAVVSTPSAALTGVVVHQGMLNISLAAPPPHLTRYEMFGCESLAACDLALPVFVTSLAAQVPDPEGTRTHFIRGRWISVRLPCKENP